MSFFFFLMDRFISPKTVRRVCNFLSSVSSQQKFGAMDIKALGTSQLSDSVIAPCYSSVLFRKPRKGHPRGVRACRPKRPEEKRERERAHVPAWERDPGRWPAFLCVFPSPWACPV